MLEQNITLDSKLFGNFRFVSDTVNEGDLVPGGHMGHFHRTYLKVRLSQGSPCFFFRASVVLCTYLRVTRLHGALLISYGYPPSSLLRLHRRLSGCEKLLKTATPTKFYCSAYLGKD